MEIIVEIGTEEQKRQIEQELETIKTISTSFNLSLPIICIIVPDDFDKKTNEIQNTSTYKSIRENHHAYAKTIHTSKGIFLVFSKFLFTEIQDNVTRFQFYMHEFMHVINKELFPKLEDKFYSKKIYLENLYILFDEYRANRKSFEIIDKLFSQTSPRYKLNNRRNLKWFVKQLIDNSVHYDIIRLEIEKFRTHGEVELFLKNTTSHFDEASKALIYSYSFIDHSPKFRRFQPFLLKSKFVNDKTIGLINFYRSKFNEGDADLSDGINVMVGFMENFGIRLEDTTQGIYYNVIDI